VATCRSALQGVELSGALTLAFPPLDDNQVRLYLLGRVNEMAEKRLAESVISGLHAVSVSQLLSARASRVLSEGLSAMLLVCRHPPSLWRLLESVWLRLFELSIGQSVEHVLVSVLRQQAAAEETTLRVPSGPEVRAALQFAVSLPAYGMALEDAADERVVVRFGDWSERGLVVLFVVC
jgi:hypothetical protein